MRKYFVRGFLVLSFAALSACGGGSVFEGAATDTGTDTGTVATASTMTLIASSGQLSSNAVQQTSGVILTATPKDSGNNIINGAAVSFTTTDTGVNLTVTRGTTDATGTAQAVLTVGDNQQNRAVVVTATSGAATDTVTVNITGTTLTLSGPTSAQFNVAATYVATLADSGGTGISGQAIQFSSTGGSFSGGGAATTNGSGQATITFTPTTGANSTTITASALGVTASQTVTLSQDLFSFTAPTANLEIPLGASQSVSITWTRSGSAAQTSSKPVTFSATRGTFTTTSTTTNGSGVASTTISSTRAGIAILQATGTDTVAGVTPTASISVEFVATTPAQVALRAEPSVIGTDQASTITAEVRDGNNNLVKNQTVLFSNPDDTTGGTLSAPSAVTNSQGIASVVYQATSTPSAQDGVVIVATVQGTPITDSVPLTVGSQAARIILGTGNELIDPADDTTTYRAPYTAIVTDNAGNAAAGADLRLRVAAVEFSKGYYFEDEDGNIVQVITATCPNEDLNLDGILQDEDLDNDGVLDAGEDANSDGILTDEDTDGDGKLDPSNVASVPPGALELDENGQADFEVIYTKDRGNWSRVRLTATSGTVSGTEATESVTFDLKITEADSNNPPGNPSPYGVVSRCDLDDNNVPLVQFQSSISTSTEGTGSTTAVNIVVTANQTFTEDVVIPVSYGGIADNGVDYTAPTSVTITQGNTTANLTVTLTGDASDEVNESVVIFMGQPSNARLGGNTVHTLTIQDDD